MITQKCQMELKEMVCDFGKGDIYVGMNPRPDDPNKVSIEFANGKPLGIGTRVYGENSPTPLIMNFDNVESLEAIKEVAEAAITTLKVKKEYMAEPKEPEFIVKTDSILVTEVFRRSNPSPLKVMEDTEKYLENGDIKEIVVSENLILKDGYIGLLIARKYNKSTVKVSAPDGIIILVGNKAINFKSDKIALLYGDTYGKYGDTYGNQKQLAIINSGNRYMIPAETPEKAVEMLEKINKVFTPDYTIVGRGSSALADSMEKRGMAFKHM